MRLFQLLTALAGCGLSREWGIEDALKNPPQNEMSIIVHYTHHPWVDTIFPVQSRSSPTMYPFDKSFQITSSMDGAFIFLKWCWCNYNSQLNNGTKVVETWYTTCAGWISSSIYLRVMDESMGEFLTFPSDVLAYNHAIWIGNVI